MAESEAETKEALEKRKRNQPLEAQEQQNLTVAQRASKIKAENNARSLVNQFPQLTQKAKSLFSAFDVLASNDGWDKKKELQEFQATATTSLGAIGGGVGMGIRESDGELKAKMNAAIDSMKADGSLNTLIKKWFGQDANTF